MARTRQPRRAIPRPEAALLHRDVGAPGLLPDARHPLPLRDRHRARRPGLHQRRRRRDLRHLHGVRLLHALHRRHDRRPHPGLPAQRAASAACCWRPATSASASARCPRSTPAWRCSAWATACSSRTSRRWSATSTRRATRGATPASTSSTWASTSAPSVSALLAAPLRNLWSFNTAFAAAGVGMLVGVVILVLNWKRLEGADRKPEVKAGDFGLKQMFLTILAPAVGFGVIGYFVGPEAAVRHGHHRADHLRLPGRHAAGGRLLRARWCGAPTPRRSRAWPR